MQNLRRDAIFNDIQAKDKFNCATIEALKAEIDDMDLQLGNLNFASTLASILYFINHAKLNYIIRPYQILIC